MCLVGSAPSPLSRNTAFFAPHLTLTPDREAYDLTRVMQLYNICVIVLNAYIGYEMVVTAYKEELTLMYVFASSSIYLFPFEITFLFGL